MADSEPTHPVTLPVTNLAASTDFYLLTLRPLGYHIVSQIQHQTATVSSTAVGIGPQGTRRVDLFLSQSSRNANQSHGERTAHIVFPAASRVAVRDFYAAALNAGAEPIASPETSVGDSGKRHFAATIVDADGNKVEVCYCDSDQSSNAVPFSTQRSAAAVTGNAYHTTASGDSGVHGPSDGSPEPRSAAAGSVSGPVTPSHGKSPPTASAKRNSTHSSTNEQHRASFKSGGNGVVGALLGAAAGAGIAYAMVKSKEDSRLREEEDKLRRAQTLRNEASNNVDNHEMPQWRVKARSTRRNSLADRDSGYHSAGSFQHESPTRRYRRITYPQPRSEQSRRAQSVGPPQERTLRSSPEAPSIRTKLKAIDWKSLTSRPGPYISEERPPSLPPGPPPPPGAASVKASSHRGGHNESSKVETEVFTRSSSRTQKLTSTETSDRGVPPEKIYSPSLNSYPSKDAKQPSMRESQRGSSAVPSTKSRRSSRMTTDERRLEKEPTLATTANSRRSSTLTARETPLPPSTAAKTGSTAREHPRGSASSDREKSNYSRHSSQNCHEVGKDRSSHRSNNLRLRSSVKSSSTARTARDTTNRSISAANTTRTARAVPLPPSTATGSARTAREVPLPSSTANSNRSHRTYHSTRESRLPPAASRANSVREPFGGLGEDWRDEFWAKDDDAETLVPDDSISNVPGDDEDSEDEDRKVVSAKKPAKVTPRSPLGAARQGVVAG